MRSYRGIFNVLALAATLLVYAQTSEGDAEPHDAGLAEDSLALVALYKATDGPNWVQRTNWLSGPVALLVRC